MLKNSFFAAAQDARKYLDVTILVLAFASGVLFHGTTHELHHTYATGAAWVIFKFSFLFMSGTYDRFWRYTSLKDLAQTLIYTAIADIAGIILLKLTGFTFPEALLMSSLALWGLTAARLWKRLSFERTTEVAIKENGKRTLIVGLNKQAQLFAHRALKDHTLSLWPVAILSTDKDDVGMTIESIPVIGEITNLEDICVRMKIQEVVVADGALSGNQLELILASARKLQVRPRMLSGQGLESADSKKYELFKDVNLEDLLTRDKVVVDSLQIEKAVKDRIILVTGAGGSIGSELCRQLMAMLPARMVLADHSEFNLYTIHKELCDKYPTLIDRIVPVLLDVKDKREVELVFEQHAIDFVYHAAAYKHVHLVEVNPLVSILNNVLGTMNMLDICMRHEVERFVLISSDKAVNPTSVMGSTKRVCELLTTMAAMKTNRPYCSVRFGNVLGSSGSFIPLLKQQVRNGGPVTITDPRMQRYFMTIPEAVSLVLEASRVSNPGDINVLKMGEPIMIVDIAKKIMTLMGKTETEVPIIFTGIRPGEKLYEELYLCGDEVQTHHKDIVVLPRGDAFSTKNSPEALMQKIEIMCELALNNNITAVRLLRQLVEEHKRERPEIAEIAA